MANEKTLDTPFAKGEKVLTTRQIDGIESGSAGKVQLSNGLGVWNRYWVRFNDGRLVGQITHDDLVRPAQVELWEQRKEDDRAAAERAETEAASPAPPESESAPSDAPASSGDSLASRIPEDLLERSRAAKARLLG